MKTKDRIIMLLQKYRNLHVNTETEIPRLAIRQLDLDDFFSEPNFGKLSA